MILLMLNIVNVGALAKLPWFIIVSHLNNYNFGEFNHLNFFFPNKMIVLDVLIIVGMVTISVFCALREDDIQGTIKLLNSLGLPLSLLLVNSGAYAAAAVI